MARKSSSRDRRDLAYRTVGRKAYAFTNRLLPLRVKYLNQVQDFRRFHPEGEYRPLLNTQGFSARLEVRPPTHVKKTRVPFTQTVLPTGIGFRAPMQLLVCIRRKQRREVLFAQEIAGRRGLGRGKKQRRNDYSEVSC